MCFWRPPVEGQCLQDLPFSVGFVQAMDPIAVTKGYQGEILESELIVVCEQNIEKLVRLRSLWLRINPILINSLYATVCNIVFVQQ